MTQPTTPDRIQSIGPWPSGMDNQDDNVLITDRAVQSAINLLFDDFGVPSARPGITKLYHGNSIYGSSGTVFNILGLVRSSLAVGKVFVVVQVTNSVGNQLFYIGLNSGLTGLNATPFSVVTFANAYQFAKVLEYNGKIYFIPEYDGSSVAQKASIGPPIGAYIAVPAMPQGDQAFILRDRMFIVNKSTSRIYYSKVTDPETWAAPDGGFFDVSPSDGEPITSVVVSNDLIYVFKLTRTWIFGFSSDPALDGTLRLVNTDEGAIDSVEYGGSIYVLTRNGVAQLVNSQYIDIGRPIVKRLNSNMTTIASGIFVLGKYLYAYFGNTTTIVYAMNLNTRAWSQLQFTTVAGFGNPFSTVYGRLVNLEGTPFYIGSNGSSIWLYNIDGTALYDTDNNNAVWSPQWYLKTKRFTISSYVIFKRLMYLLLYSVCAVDVKDNTFTITSNLEANNANNATAVDLGRTPNEFKRVSAGGRFNACSFEVNKPASAAALPGITIDTAGRPVGLTTLPVCNIKQIQMLYKLTTAHEAV